MSSHAEKSDADPFFGRMNDPTGSAVVLGLCGDEMEVYLEIRDHQIVAAKYYTEGCLDTHQCGRLVAERATGLSVLEALKIAPYSIIEAQPDLPESGRHCAILATTALYRAIADYLLKP